MLDLDSRCTIQELGPSRPRCWQRVVGKTSSDSPTSSTAVAVSRQSDSRVEFILNGEAVSVEPSCSLLEALREQLGVFSPKDGCSPQGQCGCCTVWVDGAPRVSCVTPVGRVAGRLVTTVEGLDNAEEWAARLVRHGASQCGFCTPGILMRLAAMRPEALADESAVRKAMLSHLCRCTGWQPIVDAALSTATIAADDLTVGGEAEAALASRRAEIEGGVSQKITPATALGRGGFADDHAPSDAVVGLRSVGGEWAIAPNLAAARNKIDKVQGRRTTIDPTWPVAVPEGTFDRLLQTTWTEPGYLEPDASWCIPGGDPSSPFGNGGAFGGKTTSDVVRQAVRLSGEEGAAVRALYSREDVVRLGPKRPPLSVGMNADGSGVVKIGVSGPPPPLDHLRRQWPSMAFELVDVAGPPTSLDLRAAVEMELRTILASFQDGPEFEVTTPNGAVARARLDDDLISVWVRCGQPLSPSILTSYCTGAAHMGYSLVSSEALRVGEDGVPADLTIRSFGICRAIDTPRIEVVIEPSDDPPVNGSDAVLSAVAAATWAAHGIASRWPARLSSSSR